MSTSVQVVVIVNLMVMVMGLAGFVIYQLVRHQHTQHGWAAQVQQLKKILTRLRNALQADPDADNRDHQSAASLRTHQLNILNATLELEKRIAHTNPGVATKLAAQLNALKTQASYAHKMSERLGSQVSSGRVRRLSLENKMQQKQAALNKARSVNRQLKDHYTKTQVIHKRILKRLVELRTTKNQLTQAAAENRRLNVQLSDLHRLQGG